MGKIKTTGIDSFNSKLRRGLGVEVGRKIYLQRRAVIEDYAMKTLRSAWAGQQVEIKFSKVYAGFHIDVTGPNVLFLEYGAGIKYSSQKHPEAEMHGYGPGTFNPNSGRWKSRYGWFYKGPGGRRIKTYGNPAYAYTYNARIRIMDKIIDEFGFEGVKEW